MISILRTTSENPAFQELVRHLDAELRVRDGDEAEFYLQFNKIDTIKHALIAYDGEEPVGCGALRAYETETVEVKRMFVALERRGQGIASQILSGLETWAVKLGFRRCILETGKKQPEAVALYTKAGYTTIQNYGQYQTVDNSVCFEKVLVGP